VLLPPNLAGERDAIHGQGWRNAWRVGERSPSRARLIFDHGASDWPWDYRAEQTLDLSDRSLVHTLSVTNTSRTPMPAGLGLHPYFPRDRDTRLEADIDGVWLAGDAPPARPPLAWDWRGGRPVTEFVDHQFSGWTGAARLSWPRRGLRVEMTCEPATPYLVVYAPVGENYLCVEPISHRLDAVNRSARNAGRGMAVLEPGKSTSMTVRFAWEAFQPTD
jgi:aldose 1-epimerase